MDDRPETGNERGDRRDRKRAGLLGAENSGKVAVNLMIPEHGIGPIHARCRTCAHLVVAGRGRTPAEGLLYECRKFDRSRVLGTGRRILQHRLSWPACGLYVKGEMKGWPGSGRPGVKCEMVKVSCPSCGRLREVSRSYIESIEDYDSRCKACKYLKSLSPERGKKERPELDGCSPVPARLGKRCAAYFDCPNQWICLGYAAHMNWDGFVGSKNREVVDVVRNVASGGGR